MASSPLYRKSPAEMPGLLHIERPGESTGPIWDTAVMKDRRTVNPTRGEPLRPPRTPAEGGPGGHPRATMNACPRGAPMPSTSFRRKGVQGVTPWGHESLPKSEAKRS